MLKILQARLLQYVSCEFPDVQGRLWRGGGTKDQIANTCSITKKAKEHQKNIFFCFTDYTKAFDYVGQNKLEDSSRDGSTRPPYLSPRNLSVGQEAS